MAKGPVVSHWDHLLDGFQHSSRAFYEALEKAIGARQIPGATLERVEFSEGGLLSAKREYLRVSRREYAFDVCAAPFGSGFFVSWWLTKPVRIQALLYTVLFLLGSIFLMQVLLSFLGFTGLVLTFFALAAILVGLGYAMEKGYLGSKEAVLAMPVIGRIYEMVFRPQTYYKIDTALMFQSAVHAAVQEVIDGLTSAKGIRALSELERKPIMKEFFGRS